MWASPVEVYFERHVMKFILSVTRWSLFWASRDEVYSRNASCAIILISMFLLQFVSWIQIRDLVLFPMPRTTITTDIQTLVNGLYMVVVVVTGIDSMILVNARRNALKSRSQKIVRIILINVCFSCVFNHIFFSSLLYIFYWMQDIPRSKLTI